MTDHHDRINDEAAARLLALADARRLDWLEAAANRPGGLLLHDGTERGRTGLGLRPGALVRTLREAIDAAMTTTISREPPARNDLGLQSNPRSVDLGGRWTMPT
jgi:hypothetical protein